MTPKMVGIPQLLKKILVPLSQGENTPFKLGKCLSWVVSFQLQFLEVTCMHPSFCQVYVMRWVKAVKIWKVNLMLLQQSLRLLALHTSQRFKTGFEHSLGPGLEKGIICHLPFTEQPQYYQAEPLRTFHSVWHTWESMSHSAQEHIVWFLINYLHCCPLWSECEEPLIQRCIYYSLPQRCLISREFWGWAFCCWPPIHDSWITAFCRRKLQPHSHVLFVSRKDDVSGSLGCPSEVVMLLPSLQLNEQLWLRSRFQHKPLAAEADFLRIEPDTWGLESQGRIN